MSLRFLLFVIFAPILAAGSVAAPGGMSMAVQADSSLPAVMLGEWCKTFGTTLFDMETTERLGRAFHHSRMEEGDECEGGPLTVRRDGYSTSVLSCRFVSLHRTGRVETLTLWRQP